MESVAGSERFIMERGVFKIPQSMLTELTAPHVQFPHGHDVAKGGCGRGAEERRFQEREFVEDIADMIIDGSKAGYINRALGMSDLANHVVKRMQTPSLTSSKGSDFNPWPPHCRAASVPLLDPAHADVCKDYLNGILEDLSRQDSLQEFLPYNENLTEVNLQSAQTSDLKVDPRLHKTETEASDERHDVHATKRRVNVHRGADDSDYSPVCCDTAQTKGRQESMKCSIHQDRIDELSILTERLSALLDDEKFQVASKILSDRQAADCGQRQGAAKELVVRAKGAAASNARLGAVSDDISQAEAGEVTTDNCLDYDSRPSITEASKGVQAEAATPVRCASFKPVTEVVPVFRNSNSSMANGGVSASSSSLVKCEDDSQRTDARVSPRALTMASWKDSKGWRVQAAIYDAGLDAKRDPGTGSFKVGVGSAMGRVTEIHRAAKLGHAAESSYVMTKICKKLASKVKGLSSMFAQFDRPDWSGETDKSIDVMEFEAGILNLGLDLTSQQIKDVFNMVDKNGNGLIDLKEFESALRAHGAIRPVAVKKAGIRSVRIDRSSVSASAKQGVDTRSGQIPSVVNKLPTQPAGLTRSMAAQLTALHQGVNKGQRMVEDLCGVRGQFEAIRQQYETALSRVQVAETISLMDAAESLVQRLDDGVAKVSEHLQGMHHITISIVQQVPHDVRVVWKQALCREIDATSAQLRGLLEKLPELGKLARSLSSSCHEWRKCIHQVVELQNSSDENIDRVAMRKSQIANEEDHWLLLQESDRWLTFSQHYSFATPSGDPTAAAADHMDATRDLAEALQAIERIPSVALEPLNDSCLSTREISFSAPDGLQNRDASGKLTSSVTKYADTQHEVRFHLEDGSRHESVWSESSTRPPGARVLSLPQQRVLSLLGEPMDYGKILSELHHVQDERENLGSKGAYVNETGSTEKLPISIASEVSMRVGRALRHLSCDSATNDMSIKAVVSAPKSSPKEYTAPPPRKMAFGRPYIDRGGNYSKLSAEKQRGVAVSDSSARLVTPKNLVPTSKYDIVEKDTCKKVGISKLAARRVSKRPHCTPNTAVLSTPDFSLQSSHQSQPAQQGSASRGSTWVGLVLEGFEFCGVGGEQRLCQAFATAIAISCQDVSCLEIKETGKSQTQASIRLLNQSVGDLEKFVSNVASALWLQLPLMSISVGDKTFRKQFPTASPPRHDVLSEYQRAELPELNADYEQVMSGIQSSPSNPFRADFFGDSPLEPYVDLKSNDDLKSTARLHTTRASEFCRLPKKEEDVVDWVQAYLHQHLYARVLLHAAASTVHRHDASNLARECGGDMLSDSSTRLLGAEGLQLLMHAGVEVSDAEILAMASEALDSAAKEVASNPDDAYADLGLACHDHDATFARMTSAEDPETFLLQDSPDMEVESLVLRMFLQAAHRDEVEVAKAAAYVLEQTSLKDLSDLPSPNTVLVGQRAGAKDEHLYNDAENTFASARTSSPVKICLLQDLPKRQDVTNMPSSSPPRTQLEEEDNFTTRSNQHLDAKETNVELHRQERNTVMPHHQVSTGDAHVSSDQVESYASNVTFEFQDAMRKIADSLQALERRIPDSPPATVSPVPTHREPQNAGLVSLEGTSLSVQDAGSMASEIALALHQHMKQDAIVSLETTHAGTHHIFRQSGFPENSPEPRSKIEKIFVKDVACGPDEHCSEVTSAESDLVKESVDDCIESFGEQSSTEDRENMSKVSDSGFSEEDISHESSTHLLSWINLLSRDVAVGSPLMSSSNSLHSDQGVLSTTGITATAIDYVDRERQTHAKEDETGGRSTCDAQVQVTSIDAVNGKAVKGGDVCSQPFQTLTERNVALNIVDDEYPGTDGGQSGHDSEDDQDDTRNDGDLSEGEMPESLVAGVRWGAVPLVAGEPAGL